MPSRALRNWQTRSRKVLDEVEAAHAVVGGGRGARGFARQQINQAYVVLLSSQFQRFCRELHDEARLRRPFTEHCLSRVRKQGASFAGACRALERGNRQDRRKKRFGGARWRTLHGKSLPSFDYRVDSKMLVIPRRHIQWTT